jgi:hypothetical protein
MKIGGADHHDPETGGRTGHESRLNARDARERQSHRHEDFGHADKELKLSRNRRVHLIDQRGWWKTEQQTVGEERQGQQHLEHPQQDIHGVASVARNMEEAF